MEALSETAATYGRVASPDLGWGTAYKTLNRRAGAFFGGFALWPKETVDASTAAPPFFRFAFFRATRGRRVAGAQPHALLWLRVARESERPLHAPGVRAAEGRARPRLSFCFFSFRPRSAPSFLGGRRRGLRGAVLRALHGDVPRLDGPAARRRRALPALRLLAALWAAQLAAAAPLPAAAAAAMADRDAAVR